MLIWLNILSRINIARGLQHRRRIDRATDRYILTKFYSLDRREEPYFNNENSISRHARIHLDVSYKLTRGLTYIYTHTYTLAARDRYEPKTGVCSLICLMSRYCNDFASDLRLFIYSPAVLADRRLITGASLVILTVLNSWFVSVSQPLLPSSVARISWTS